MIYKHILFITFLNNLELIFRMQLNGSKYYYASVTFQLNISHLFIHSEIIKQFYFQ